MRRARKQRDFWFWMAWLILIATAVSAWPLVDAMKKLPVSSGDSNLWIPEGTPERKVLDQFADRFGAKDMVMISWEGCQADDPILPELARNIIDLDREIAEDENRSGYFEKASTYLELRKSLRSQFLEDDELDKKLRDHVKGFFVGMDRETGLILLEGNSYCASHRDEAYQFVHDQCRKVLGNDTVLRFAGPLFATVCANKESRRTLNLISPFVAVISLVVALVVLRNALLATLSFCVSGFASLMSMAAIYYGGRDLGDMLGVVPSLAQLLAMSNAVHFINYYSEDWLRHHDGNRAWRYAVRVGWLPTVAASVTTMIGFGVLATSNISVAGDFAIFGAIGVVCAAVAVLVIIPTVLILTQPKVKDHHPLGRLFIDVLVFLTNTLRWPTALLLAAVLIGGGLGLMHLKSDVRTEIFFSAKSEFRQHHDWFSERFAPPQASDLMIGFPNEPGNKVDKKTQFEFIEKLADDITVLDARYAVFAPSIFAISLPEQVPDQMYDDLWERAEGAGWVKADGDRDYWRISIRHPSVPEPEDSKFLTEIRPLIAASENETDPAAEIELTGAYQVYAKSQAGLLEQLLRTFLLAFIIITPVVVIFLRSFLLGGIAILGNLFPLVVFFGVMGWLGERIDIATMMIAAVAFGIAVDDTVHFLTWLGKGFEQETSLRRSIRFAFENSAGAILQTTLIISFGMMAFLISDFRPSVRFATFSATVLIIALIGDLIFLPALIQCFSRRRTTTKLSREARERILVDDAGDIYIFTEPD